MHQFDTSLLFIRELTTAVEGGSALQHFQANCIQIDQEKLHVVSIV
jgi:hypothetical protein